MYQLGRKLGEPILFPSSHRYLSPQFSGNVRKAGITTTRIDDTAALFIAHLVSSVIYHADRDKGKCDLHGGRRQVLVEWEGQNQPEIELNDASVASCRIKSHIDLLHSTQGYC